jgi:ATP-dependent 26S proteasome regulatory subunit
MQVMKSDTLRLQHEQSVMKEKIRDNGEKIKQNKVLPYLVGNVVEVRATSSYRHSPSFIYYRSWTLILNQRKTGRIATWIQCARANVPL